MNYRGSYRKLLGNAKSAMVAAIEIYNKPTFQYRDECVVILLLNAWELVLKALLSKNGKSVFYLKKRKQPYRTLSWQDAFTKASINFPMGVSPTPIKQNLKLLGTYRDNAVHFYNAKGFGVVFYALAQTCIKNFRDLLEESFGMRLEDEINWQLLPLGINPPVDVITYLSGQSTGKQTSAVQRFLEELKGASRELTDAEEDTGRLMTIFSVNMESVKKIGDADVIVGVTNREDVERPLAVVKPQDPNITHPLREKDVLEKIKALHGEKFTPYRFQAIVFEHDLKAKPQYCWKAKDANYTKFSNNIIAYIKRLSLAEFKTILSNYRKYMQAKRKRKKGSTNDPQRM